MIRTHARLAATTGLLSAALVGGGLSAPASAQSAGLGLSDEVITKLRAAAAAATLDDSDSSPARLAALCGDTNFTVWIRQNTAGLSKTDLEDLDAVSLLPLIDASYYPLGRQSFGEKGQYTKVLGGQMGRLRTFWNINGKRVSLAAMHSNLVMNTSRVARIYRDFGGMSAAEANRAAAATRKLMNQKKFHYGRHPVITLNAFAVGTQRVGGRTTTPRIVMGDGIMRAMAELGWGSVAAQEILAHEYGHQVQIANRSLKPGSRTPAQSRYLELMADAYGAYYLHHPRGGRMNWKNVNTFLQVVYATGDCSFTNNAHHGTPDQRMAAANWGAAMVYSVGTGKIAPTKSFANAYARKHPSIVR